MNKLIAIGALGAAVAASPAQAAPVAASPQSESRALILRALSFVSVDDLDFGTVVSSSVAGTVTINASTGVRSIVGGVTGMPAAPGGKGYFAGAGSPGQQVIISMTPATQLTDALTGFTIPVVAMGLDGGTTRTINATTLTFFVGVGGTILLAANQPDGDYESDFDITADYQ